MLDCIEENLTRPFTLDMLAKQLNYSPYYCTRQFHKYAGISLRDYIRLRKVSAAVIDLRDTDERIIDIAVKYGFSSQEAGSVGQDEQPQPHASSCLNFFKKFRIRNAAAITTIKMTISVCILFHRKPEGGSNLKNEHR